MAESRPAAGATKRPRLQPGHQTQSASPAGDVEEVEQPDGVAMSVACWGGRVGVAWYSQEDGEVRSADQNRLERSEVSPRTTALCRRSLLPLCAAQ